MSSEMQDRGGQYPPADPNAGAAGMAPPPEQPQAPVTPSAKDRAASRKTAGHSPRKSPALAGWLSLMPGLGQIYVGYYQQGFFNIVVIASLITMLVAVKSGALDTLLAVFMAFYWLYNIIDAIRRASLFNQVLAGREEIDLPDGFGLPGGGGSLVGGVALIVLGALLLMHTRFDHSLAWVEEWWPLGAIFLGVYLLYKHRQGR